MIIKTPLTDEGSILFFNCAFWRDQADGNKNKNGRIIIPRMKDKKLLWSVDESFLI